MAIVPTAEQKAVVHHLDGTLVVLAAVGSGKTTTLSHRIAHALATDTSLRPERVLALTFTNRAADHMRESLEKVVGPLATGRMTISTFHALCARILRSDPPGAGLPADFRILDEDDVTELLADLGVSGPVQAMHALGRAASATPLGACIAQAWHRGTVGNLAWMPRYAAALAQRGAVDFAGLVYLTRALLTQVPEASGRWSTAYDMVLVDEVQDTHLSEYEVLRVLAARASSLCLVGDLDQTIYSWRGSAPQKLLDHLDADFGPVHSLHLTRNFRSTRNLLAAAEALAGAMPDRASEMRPADSLASGEAPRLTTFSSQQAEARAIATSVASALAAGTPPERCAILVRSHKAIPLIAKALEHLALPHTTAEHFRFFRRMEIKDALAVARLVHDRHDEVAARRIANKMVRNVGPVTLKRIREEGRPVGLRLTDFLDAASIRQGDPFWVLERPDCIVLDTETTGFDPDEDEVIEVAAVRLRGGVYSGDSADRFAALIRNTVPVGKSEAVHGISDATLAKQGRDPGAVFAELRDFIGALPIAGHNVSFDQRMLEGHSRRVGIPLPLRIRFDTLPFARRLVPDARNHKLGTLVEHLQIPFVPTHRALDDVLATVELARVLAERAVPGARQRQALLTKDAPLFARLRSALERWSQRPLRPAALLRTIIREVLKYSDAQAPKRFANLELLVRQVEGSDNPALPPHRALAQLLERAALARDVDALDGTPGVRVLTMHQSKGLEFDHVYIPGLTDGKMPTYFAVQRLRERDDREGINEERRLLYVAMTRARTQLDLSWFRRDADGRGQEASRFLGELGRTVRHLAGP